MNDVRHTVTDGLLGLAGTGEGKHIKIGASPAAAGSVIEITAGRSVEYIREKLGYSPLADAAMNSIENGAEIILCIPVQANISGTISAVTAQKADGSGTLTAAGSPYNVFRIQVRITGKGGFNVAAFQYSINGGYSWSDELSVPLNGTYAIPDTGVSVTFNLGEGEQFEVNDLFSFETAAPQMTNNDVIHAVSALSELKTEVEMVHIVGPCSVETWAAVSALQEELAEQRHKPLLFVLEAQEISEGMSVEEYRDSLLQDRKQIRNYNIQVVAARALYAGMDGVTRNISAADLIMGAYARVAVNRSIGETAVIYYTEDKVLQLLPAGMTEEDIDRLDSAGYLTMRQYDGLGGYYVTNARVMGPEITDYRYAEDVRVLNKIIRETRKKALMELQGDIDLENPQADIAVKAKQIQIPLDDMVTAKEISSGEVTVPDGQDYLATETLQLLVRFIPRGKIRSIDINIGMKNPYKQ